MKRLLLCFFLCFIYVLAQCAVDNPGILSANLSESFPTDKIDLVVYGLQHYLGKIPLNSLGDYGLHSTEELTQARIGESYKLYVIDPDKVLTSQDSSTLEDVLIPSTEWFFTVMIKKEIIAMLRVEQDANGEWQIVSFGYAPLAKQIQQAQVELDLQSSAKPALIVSYQANEFFLGFPFEKPTYLFPLQYNITANSKPETELQPILKRLQPIIRRSLQPGF